MATACLRLMTFLRDRPLRKVPRLRSRMTFAIFFDALRLYLPIVRALESDARIVCLHDDECHFAYRQVMRGGNLTRIVTRHAVLAAGSSPRWNKAFTRPVHE
jgi:hypothetical protein